MSVADYCKSDVRLIVLDENSVELRVGVWNTVSTVFTDKDKKGVLAKLLLGLCDGSIDGKSSEFSIEESDISGVLTNLLEVGYLIPKNKVSAILDRSYICGARSHAVREAQPIPDRVRLLAPQHLSNLFLSMIPEMDRKKFTCLADGDRLSSSDFFQGQDLLKEIDVLRDYDYWKDSLVCFVSNDFNPMSLSNINKLAHRVGFIALSAVVDGPFLMLGPSIFSGNTPCFRCAEIRLIDMMRDHTVYMRYKEALAQNKERRFAPAEMSPFQATVVSLAAWECLNILSTGASFTTSKLLTVYGPSMEFAFNEIVRVPNCEVCGNKPGLDTPLYSDLQAFIQANY